MKIYHVDITRPSGFARTADQIAETTASEKSAEIGAVGGEISVSRTFDIDRSVLVVILPDDVDISKFFVSNVRPFNVPPVAPAASNDEPAG